MLDQWAWPTVHTTRSASFRGNRQRLNIAIGLSEPPVLLLDEPSAALDPRQRERLWEFVGEPTEAGTTIVYSTHNVQEAERHAHRGGASRRRAPVLRVSRRLEEVVGASDLDFEAAFVAFLHQHGH